MNKGQDSSEILRLRKELVHARTQIADLQEELEEKTNLYVKAIQDRDQYKEKLSNAKESIHRVENIVQSKVSLALDKERKELVKLREENDLLRKRIELFDQERLNSQQREKQLQDQIIDKVNDLKYYARNADMRDCMQRIDLLRAEKETKEQKIVEQLQFINKLSHQVEDLAAENRTLRKMANVPENYGINLEQIKLHDREKIDDYKKLIRVLQEDNYRLEEERARLKHMLKQQSMLYKTDNPSQRYKDLNPEQLFKVDQFVLKLIAGETEEPADFYKLKKENQILKAQLDALNTKGFDFAKAQIEVFLKELGLGDSGKLLERLMSGNEELKKMLRELLTKGLMATSVGDSGPKPHPFGDQGRFRPPQPHVGVDGEIPNGFSFKFQTHLDVYDKDGRNGLGDQTKYDVAFLQLQLQEFVELLKRKDEELLTKNGEIESLYKNRRDYLLVQDQLYKDFVKMEKDFNVKKDDLELNLRNTRDSLNEEQLKVRALENVIQTLQKGDRQSIEQRLIELTKQNSIIEVNLMRLTRKYQLLAEQEEMLRRDYHNWEAEMAEKDKFVQLRINVLKEWKARAIQQLKFLFTKLRLAVPKTEFESIQSENEILKLKNADFIERNSKLAERVSKLQTQVRENMEAEERLKVLSEMKDDLENEYELVKKRLETVDQQFRWENAVFNKVVALLKRYRVSPQQAFDEFDVNKDGKLTRDEFVRALDMLKIQDLSNAEVDILMSSLDYDTDGYVRYKEFVRKLSRHGVKSRTNEEQIIYLLIESLRRTGIKSMSDAFSLFDKENRGSLSREDFKDVFKNMKLRIEDNDIEKFIDHFWKDQKAGIDYQAFLRIFNRYQVRLEDDEQKARKGHDRIPDDVLRLKKRIYTEMQNAFNKSGKTLKHLFDKVDVDQSNQIELDEFRAMFAKMNVKLTEVEVNLLFNSIDFDASGKVTYPEFIADFKRTCETDIMTLLAQEKERAEMDKRANSYSMGSMNQTNDEILKQANSSMALGTGTKQSQEIQMQTRIAILEAREKQLHHRLDVSMRVLNHAQQSQLEVQTQYDQLEKRWNELTEQFHVDKQRLRDLEEHLRHSIRKDDAVKLQELNERIRTELTETKAAMTTYKNMTEVISDQVRGLKLASERKKDEHENLVNAVRELSAQSEDQKRLGKLYYIIMLSRWQEAAVNKKYEMALTENRDLRKEMLNFNQMLQTKEYEHHECENLLQDRHLVIEQLKKQIADSKNIFLTLDKAEELNHIIKEISDEKTDLEEQYFQMRSKYRSNQLMMDEAVSKAEHASELLDALQREKQSELSDRLIALSEKLQGIKLSEMRSQRESGETKEKNNYLSRLLRQANEAVRKFEERVAELESKIHKREEEFRKADNDRMRRFFNARFDDIPGAIRGSQDDMGGGFPGSARQRGQVFEQESFQAKGRSARKQDEIFSSRSELHTSFEAQRIQGTATVGLAQQQASNDARYMEGKIKRLEAELNKAIEDSRSKELIINRFKEWQLADKYLAEDEVLRDAIENQRTKVNQVHEQESKEMAEAAAQMVKTLQEMLDQKNEQLKSKEDIIARLREQMMQQREQDGIEIARLQQQLSLAAGTTLSKLQEIVVRNEHGSGVGGGAANSRYEKLTREELSRAVDEKDQVISKLNIELRGAQEQVRHLHEKLHGANDQVRDLESELAQERQQVELKAKLRELDRVRRELQEKEKKNELLRKAVDQLNERMQNYEIQKSDVSEDQKMRKIQEDLQKKEHDTELRKLKDKMAMMESSRTQRAEELKQAKVREQELQDKYQKVTLEKDEAQKALKSTRDRLDQEIRQREKLQIELNNIKGQVSIGRGLGSSTGPTYEQLLVRNKELENDNVILQCQAKTVVAYNKEVGTFEYIGEPIPLCFDRELTDVEEFLAYLRTWLKRNEMLTVKSIFEYIDKENFGELTENKFDSAMRKIGITLRVQEKTMIKQVLDTRNIGFIKYRPLVKELQGIPQLDFIIKELQKMSRLVEARDLDESQFKLLLDPHRVESMNLTQLQESIRGVCNEQFQMSAEEVESMFKNVTKSVKTIGVTISITKLTEKVFTAVDALLIEKMKESVMRSMKPLSELMSRFDSNKDGQLEYAELENMLLECSLAFKPAMLARIYNLMDPGRRASKVSANSLKFYLSDYGYSGASQHHHMTNAQRSYDFEPTLERASLSLESTQEEITTCRSGARKILQSFQNTLSDQLNARDKHNEGIINKEEVQKCIEEQKVPDLTPGELLLLLKYVDRGNKGFIAIPNFITKLVELATETKQDTTLRAFATACKRQGINLRQELFKYDSTRTGRIDRKTFAKAMNQLPVSLNDEAVDLLFQSGEIPEFRGQLDIKTFIEKVIEAQKYKPMQQNFAQLASGKTGSVAAGATKSKLGLTAGQQPGQGTEAFATWEVEKKYKTKLAALQQQIEESKKETQATEKQAKHWQEMANRLEKEKNSLQARLVDINAKPPKAATYESLNQAQLEQMQQLKDQVFYLQEENNKLEQNIQVALKAEIARQAKDNDTLTEKNRSLADEVKRLQYQVNRLIGKPMDDLEKREEGELWRERRIKELESEIAQRDAKEQELQDQLFKADERLLDLKFQKETFDLQFARLQKRITDLEQYKLASSKFSAVLRKGEGQQLEAIEEAATSGTLLTPGQSLQLSKKEQDTVKLRSRSTKSLAELEMLVESLKRVIEKQKAENDSLKKQMEAQETHKDKLKSEKQLRQKIEALEQEVHSYEMKDVNLSEKERTIKKLIEANRDLREDLRREAERYGLLENKYKELLIKYNVLAKENAKNTEMLFTMNTGGNIKNYQGFLTGPEKSSSAAADQQPSGKKPLFGAGGASGGDFYDRNFEDIF